MRLNILFILIISVLSFSHNAFATGDCNGDKQVTISEVQSAINMFLGLKVLESCVDEDNNGSVSIAEVQKTINTFLGLTDVIPPTLNKNATIKFYSHGTNPNDSISGFTLKTTIPFGSTLPTGTDGGPLPGVVEFAGTNFFADNFFDNTSRQLNSQYILSPGILVSDFIKLGEFITIIVSVPLGYTPNADDISYSFQAINPDGVNMPTVTTTFTFN